MSNQSLAGPPTDVRAAKARFDVLGALQLFNDKDVLDNLIRADGWTIVTSGLAQAAGVQPHYYFADCNGATFVFFDGLTTPQQGQAFYDSYLDTSQTRGGEVYLGYASDRGEYAAVSIGAAVRTNPRLFVCGYSAGGAYGLFFLPTFTGLMTGPFESNLIAFGSPQPASWRLNESQGWTSITHWFNSDDAVPLVPPHVDLFPRIMAGLTVFQGNRLNSFRGLPGGQNIGLDGQITQAQYPQTRPTPALTAIGQWIEQTQAGNLTPHSVGVYSARLTAAVSLLTPAQSVVPQGPPPDTTPIPPRSVIQAAINTTVQTQFSDATRQNSQPVTIPTPQLFHAVKQGRTWFVQFGGTTIASAPYKRRARGLANAGNDFIRRLQNEGQVNAQDLAVQWVTYLALASNPTSGFIPTLNVPP